MPSSLLTAASGLLAHQSKLDVVANNLANLNTVAYKSRNILFADLIYSTFKKATTTDFTQSGGTNPRQIGNGVQIASISRDESQGVLDATGGELDFAIEGEGYFVMDGGRQLYTRDGSFSLDAQGYLVDPATGAFVQRYGVVGEGLDGKSPFPRTGRFANSNPAGNRNRRQGNDAGRFRGQLAQGTFASRGRGSGLVDAVPDWRFTSPDDRPVELARFQHDALSGG